MKAIWAKALDCNLEASVCSDDLWQCQTCREWYCDVHFHDTSLGYCVECVSCEHARLEKQQEGPPPEMRVVDFTGTVSEATMRPQDLVPAFMDVLFKYYLEAYCLATSGIFEVFRLTYTELCGMPFHMAWQSSEMGYLLHEDLWDAMNEIAPAGYYFGAHPGDGSDYGYWKILDSDEETCCQCCGRGDLTLLTCPKCDELLCQNCLDEDMHLCEPD